MEQSPENPPGPSGIQKAFSIMITGALLSLGREMFRLEILEDIARDKVRTLHFVER
ncbi:NEL-type E3 ubiquitin ligase domain-containing protein [Shigella boydii]|uniref:E3 ubiquitin-ligase ipaH9.8 domain protein n=1 Tax=Shigella boydii 4444-74 TaxID=766140 RepID=I6DDC3_SHIBO|nr:E3 ubiquitin-ligase ipaH9.8 domain protein [Shigella boydii 4444-74]